MADQYLKSSLLYNAIIRQDTEMVKDLLLHGANPNVVTRDGASPMHIVVGLPDSSTCELLTQLLLNWFGDSNVRDPDGITPLAIACGFGRCDIVKLLLQHGGDPQIENNDGEDCLDQAMLSGCDGCVALIRNHLALKGSWKDVNDHNTENKERVKKLPRRSSVLNYTQKVQTLIDLEYETNSLCNRTFQLDVTSPDHPVLVKRCESESIAPSVNSPIAEQEVNISASDSSTSSLSFHSVPSPKTSFSESPEDRDMKPATDTSADIENDVSPKKERKFISSEESPNKNRLISLLDNISVNSVSSLDLSLDPQDPRLLNDLTIHSDSSMNRAGLCGELESLNLCDSSIGDETLKDMKKLMLSDVSVNANKRFDESVNSTEHMGKYEDKESVSNVVVGDRKITQNAEMVLHRENNARFAKKYYIPLSENDLYTDDDSTMIENINGNPSKHIPSIDSGFVSSVRNCSVKTPIKQCMPIKNSNSMKNRLLIDKFDPSDSVVAQSRNNPEHFELNTTYICRDVSPTSLPVHPDFYCSPRTSSRCLESSLSSSGLSNHSDMSMTPEVYTSPCTSESAKQEDVPCIEMVSELSGVCRLDTTQRSTQKQHRVMESRNATYRQSLVEDTEVAKDVQNTDSETVAKEEVFCSSMLPFPQNGTSDHSKSTIFDCPSVNTPVSSVKNSFDLEKSKKELSSQTGNASVSKCCMQLVPLFDVQKAGKKKEDNVFVVSTDSKNSTCSCAEKRMNRVYSDSEGGISLVEVHLPKDDQNCSIHSESLSDKYEDSTLVLDWREQEEDSSKLSRHISTCTPVKNLQTPVKQQFLSSSPSLHKEDESYSDSTVLSTASSVQVCVSDEIKSLRDRDLRRALEAFGERPGPITISTRKAYEIRLARLQSEPATSVSKREEDVFCPELCQALNGQFILQPHDDLEISLTKMFEEPNPKKQYREGTKKTSFNYLLLDPRVTQNLPARAQNLTEEEGFEVFVKSIFYVGKGKRSRPYAHFKEAIRHITGKAAKEVSKKVLHIVKIWEAGLGVVSLHVFQNIIPTAAYTREACLIEALGLKRLTNIQRGQFYENVASWSAKKKRQAGVVLLKKAYKIFILEGERQIRAYDIKDIT